MTAGGVFSWTPTEAQGPGVYTFDVTVSDPGGRTDSQAVTLTVTETNAPPVLAAIGDKSVAEGSLLTFVATALDPDTPSTRLTFSLVGGPPSGAAITSDGTFTWTPTEAQGPGSYSITVRVADDGISDGIRTDSETIRVSVSEVNRPPPRWRRSPTWQSTREPPSPSPPRPRIPMCRPTTSTSAWWEARQGRR